VTASHVAWRYEKGLPQLTGALLYQDTLYAVRNGILLTLDPATGALLGQKRIEGGAGEYYASPVAGDGKVFVVSLEGVVTVLKAGRDWTVLGRGDLEERVVATPAIASRRVFVRTENRLFCFAAPTSPERTP
jgi:outer membrane protein assembly factor BamB